MTEQERHLPEEEIKRKLVATNALITDEELIKLRSRINMGVMTPTFETAAPIENLNAKISGERSYTFILRDIGVYADGKSDNRYLIFLLDSHGYKHFTRMRWVVEEGLLEITINGVQFREGIRSEDATMWVDFPIWEFKDPGVFLEKGGDYKGDDFAQALPLLQSYADRKI